MPKALVLVRRTADETEQVMSYKGYTYIMDDIDDITHQKKYELIGECDANGNSIPGSPNLGPQHRTQVTSQQQSAAPVANAGETQSQDQIKRRGRRPAQVTLQETAA